MDDIKRTLLKFPVIGPRYVEWRRNQKIARKHEQAYQAWLQHDAAQITLERLKAYHNKHKGRRAFIIGNGPSLKKMDLSPLRDEITFGANRIYLLFEELGFTTTYFCSVNANVVGQFSEDIAQLPMPKFITWDAKDMIPFTENMMFIRHLLIDDFHTNPLRGLWYGATVTNVSMQLAYYMGIETVYLIGVDHNFKDKGEPHKLVVSQGADENHFHPEYFGKGVKWQLPDLEMSEAAYRMAREAYKADDRQILDATVGGKLDVFPKVTYTSLFG